MSNTVKEWPITVQDGVAVVTMNSTKANVIDRDFVASIRNMLDRLEKNPEYNKLPVVLTGHGAFFSAGFDLKAFASGQTDAVGALFDDVMRMLHFPRPMIAAVNGHCMAAGFFVAISCDKLIAAEGDYKFHLTEVMIGMPFPPLGVEMLRVKVPFHVANHLALFGLPISPQEAQQCGLVHSVVPKDQLLQEAITLAKRVPPSAYDAYAIIKHKMIEPMVERLALPSTTQYADVFEKALVKKQKQIAAYVQKTLGSTAPAKSKL